MDPDNNFILEISTSLEEQVCSFGYICSNIFSRNEFADCTVCCSDGTVQAHRIILASASNYLHNMLSSTPWPTPCSHPMLFFKTFSLADMKLAMEFIYTGKTKVSKNKLPTLMNIARELGCGSLTKAIEKSIHSCGVEIFRKRIQTHVQSAITTDPTPVTHSATTFHQSKLFVSNSSQIDVNSSRQQHTKEDIRITNNDSNDFTSVDNQVEDVESICPNTIKIEPGENMTFELDPSSIATTMDSTTFLNANQHSPTLSDNINVPVDAKLDHGLSNTTESRTSNRTFEIQDDIEIALGMKDKALDQDIEEISNADRSTHENTLDADDDQVIDEDDDEEMPITVVDLKSLAETGPEMTNVISMPSSEIENSETLPANCPWCFQVFTSLTLLQRHIKTHVGKYKPYSCQYCPASFARSAHLKRHIRTHTGEKPFVCTFCSRAFSRQDKLKTHLEKHLLDQTLQNNSKLALSSGFSSLNPTNTSPTRSTAVKPAMATSTSTTLAGHSLSSHKQIMQSLSSPSLNATNYNQCISSSAYQYFVNNDTPDPWQTQADIISKGLLGVPGQITISSPISPSTTITPISSLLVHTNPPSPHL